MKKELSRMVQRALTGFASGVMVAASIWSLIIPAMEQSEPMGSLAFLPAVIGFWGAIISMPYLLSFAAGAMMYVVELIPEMSECEHSNIGVVMFAVGFTLTYLFFAAFVVMILGTVLVVMDTLVRHHLHEHKHLVTHTHNGTTHTHVVRHSHEHNHMLSDERHGHHHSKEELLLALKEVHQT